MNKALVLRVCDKDGKSYGGFQWPLTIGAEVKAPDWNGAAERGNGLYGWLYGQGDLCCDYWREPDANWMVLEVELSIVVLLDGKCKFPTAILRFVGGRKEATDYLHEHEERSRTVAVIGALRADLTQGAKVFVGHLGTATAGDRGTATAGYRGVATAGEDGTATAGPDGAATAGYRGVATAGEDGTATAGPDGDATAGDRGTATAGYRGVATAGEDGTATAGDRGVATAGEDGTATAGEDGVISIIWYDGKKYRRAIAAIGQNGIKANTPYRLDGRGNFFEATK
jgi:hypothetical protein